MKNYSEMSHSDLALLSFDESLDVVLAGVGLRDVMAVRVRDERVLLGVSQTQLAAAIGVSAGMLSAMENLHRSWPAYRLKRAVEVLRDHGSTK